MRAALLAMAVLALGAAPRRPAREVAKEPPKAADAPRALAVPEGHSLLPARAKSHPAQATACGVCHTTRSWSESKFNHEKTGFQLEGKHGTAACKACHPVDFTHLMPATCSGCHLDVHAGELGSRCEGCHAPQSWKSRFPADAHRRTGFPLVGRHAALPCGECHFTEATGRFSRGAMQCVACHQRDYDRTALTTLDHAALGFPPTCQQCHAAWSFKGARFATHDVCFALEGTVHQTLTCLECHTSIPPGLQGGTCNTRTAACTGCHEHECVKSDPVHADRNVLGYQCKDRKCYECHKFTRGAP